MKILLLWNKNQNAWSSLLRSRKSCQEGVQHVLPRPRLPNPPQIPGLGCNRELPEETTPVEHLLATSHLLGEDISITISLALADAPELIQPYRRSSSIDLHQRHLYHEGTKTCTRWLSGEPVSWAIVTLLGGRNWDWCSGGLQTLRTLYQTAKDLVLEAWESGSITWTWCIFGFSEGVINRIYCCSCLLIRHMGVYVMTKTFCTICVTHSQVIMKHICILKLVRPTGPVVCIPKRSMEKTQKREAMLSPCTWILNTGADDWISWLDYVCREMVHWCSLNGPWHPCGTGLHPGYWCC